MQILTPDWKPLISVPLAPAPTHLKIRRTAYFDPLFLSVDRAGEETLGYYLGRSVVLTFRKWTLLIEVCKDFAMDRFVGLELLCSDGLWICFMWLNAWERCLEGFANLLP
jgi:hypothetical protein